MQTATEIIEETRQRVRLGQFRKVQKILLCCRDRKDPKRCIGCSDMSLCSKLQDIVYSIIEVDKEGKRAAL